MIKELHLLDETTEGNYQEIKLKYEYNNPPKEILLFVLIGHSLKEKIKLMKSTFSQSY